MAQLRRGKWSVAAGNRWLAFERLEQRNLLAVIRLADWNTANGPNVAADPDFTTILQAIGEETVQGNTKRLDILAIQETDVIPAGNESIQKVTDILNTLYPAADYASTFSAEDGGGDSTGFVYDTTTVSLVDTPIDVSGAFTHTIRRAQFRPSNTLGESDFYVYSVHLKSGDSGSDEDTRAAEAALLRADADSLGEGAHVLMVGDFNMKTSTEIVWANLTAAGAGQLQDVVNMPGNWFNNPAFKKLHSQDPGAMMDDRLDMHFASGEFFDGTGLEYVTDSYHVFGNNGTHMFGEPITTGTGAGPAVLAALANASDHLPVIADYEVIPSSPTVRITETAGGTKVIEGGLYDTYYASLETMPAADVTVTVTPDTQLDAGDGAGVARMLTFTPANWQTPQVVEVRAANDAADEGDHTGTITHTSASSDVNYSGLSIASVTAMIVDDDAPVIVINELDADQPTNPVNDNREFVELYDGGVGNTSLTGYIVVFFNGGDSNNGSYATFDLTGRSTDANGFFLLGNPGVAGVDMTFNSSSLQNGPADAVALYFESAASFPPDTSPTSMNLRDAVLYGNTSTDDEVLRNILTPDQPLVNENQNGQAEAHSISRVPDGGMPLVTTSYVAQTPTPKALNEPVEPGVLIVLSGTRVDVSEDGAIDSYQLALLTIPSADVQVTVDPDSETDLGAGAGVPIVLTFTPANALLPQTVPVTAVDDVLVEGTHTSVITHTASGDGYDGAVIGNVVANVTDNDFTPPPEIVITEIMYNPASDESAPGVSEWIEIVNTSSEVVDMTGWMFDDEDASDWGAIPSGTMLHPGQVAVFFDSVFTDATTFRDAWSVPSSSLVVGIPWGSLLNDPAGPGDEVLRLISNTAMQMDEVNYDNSSPWPSIGGTGGPSIYLKGLTLDNSVAANWARSTAGTASAVSPTGSTFNTADTGTPGRFFLPSDYNLNGLVDAADYVTWRKMLNSNVPAGTGADGDGNGIVEQADYDLWRGNCGNVGAYYTGAGTSAGDFAADGEANSAAVGASLPGDSAPAAETAAVDVEGDGSALRATAIDVALGSIHAALPAADSKNVLSALGTAAEAKRTDCLLAVQQSRGTVGSAEASDAASWSSSVDGKLPDVDELFASLADWEAAFVRGIVL